MSFPGDCLGLNLDECLYFAFKNVETILLQICFCKFPVYGFVKFLTFAPLIINGSFTSYAKQKVSSDKSNAGDLRLSAGGS